MNKKSMNYSSPRGSSITYTKPSSIKQNEYLKNLTNLDSLKVPVVKSSERNPQANTDLSLQFCTISSGKAGGEAVGSKILLSECLEDESQNGSPNVMKTQLYRRNFAEFNNETQKKPKTLPRREQDASDCSAIDSLSGMISASSYDVARVIGEKRFSKMRTYMIKFVSSHFTNNSSFIILLYVLLFLVDIFSQQKIFAEQVFELHRLIMVSC